MEYADNRSKRIICLGSCLLNQNASQYGGAVRRGAITEVVNLFTHNGVGIEQLPCAECLEWGGVGRAIFYRFQPWGFRAVGTGWYLIFRLGTRIWLWWFARSCKRLARRVTLRIDDWSREGFDVLGIVLANDSRTCAGSIPRSSVAKPGLISTRPKPAGSPRCWSSPSGEPEWNPPTKPGADNER